MQIRGVFAIFLIIVAGMSFMFLVYADTDEEIMTVEANIIKSTPEASVSIEVPDYIFFGNLTKGEKSAEIRIDVNNTGNMDVEVTPYLADSSEKIFNYTYFRLRKTSNGTNVPFSKIGDFNFDIQKEDNEYFYMILDLTDYPDQIPEDLIAHKADIRFIAVSK